MIRIVHCNNKWHKLPLYRWVCMRCVFSFFMQINSKPKLMRWINKKMSMYNSQFLPFHSFTHFIYLFLFLLLWLFEFMRVQRSAYSFGIYKFHFVISAFHQLKEFKWLNECDWNSGNRIHQSIWVWCWLCHSSVLFVNDTIVNCCLFTISKIIDRFIGVKLFFIDRVHKCATYVCVWILCLCAILIERKGSRFIDLLKSNCLKSTKSTLVINI